MYSEDYLWASGLWNGSSPVIPNLVCSFFIAVFSIQLFLERLSSNNRVLVTIVHRVNNTSHCFKISIHWIMQLVSWIPEGGGGTWVNFAVYVLLVSRSPYPIIVSSVASYRPQLSHCWEICNFRDPNLVTFYLCLYLLNFLNKSS